VENFEERWLSVESLLQERFGKKPDMEGILFLIGMNEYGHPPQKSKFSKEQKQDLMHVAVCTLLATRGYYTFDGLDDDGWPHFTAIEMPAADNITSQERLLKECIISYFEL
jgi:hypothetical protein